MAGDIVFVRPLAFEHGLGFAVPLLLLQIRPHGIAPMMPDHSGRAESQRPAFHLQSPAHVHVVAGDVELRIESTDRLQRRAAKRHVAAGNMFGLAVGDEHVNRPARRVRDAARDEPVARRGNVGPADAGAFGVGWVQEHGCQIL